MNSTSHSFLVGGFKCTLINDGTLTYTDPAPDLFANAPHDQLEPALLRYGIQLDLWKEFISSLPCMLIDTGKHKVLIDTGLGKVEDAPNAGLLLQNLHAEGFDPGDIDLVILTHAHGDHVGWNTNEEGLATFPKARYCMAKEEWDFWTSEKTLAQPQHEWMASFVQKQLLSISSRFDLLQQDPEIVPGIHAFLAPGHTPGSLALSVTSKGEELLCVGDVIAHPLHAERPDWHLGPDCQPDQAIRTRMQLLERAAASHARVFAFHFDFPGIGIVHHERETWRWQSIPVRDGLGGY